MAVRAKTSSGLQFFVIILFLCQLSSSILRSHLRFPLPLSTNTAVASGIPAFVRGNCTEGQVYGPFTAAEDLVNLSAELECVYAAGLVPEVVPLGPYYGNVLQFLNSGIFNPLIATLWKGKYGTLLNCDDKEVRICWNIIGSRPAIPALLSLGQLDVNISTGEYDDGKGGFIIDYTKDFGMVCPNPAMESNDIDMGLLNNKYPFNQIVDVVRIVGRTPMGALIYLGKTYMKDMWREDKVASTIAFWTIKSYDIKATSMLPMSIVLPPLRESFTYSFSGLRDFAFKILPIEESVTRPVETMVTYFDYLYKFTSVFLKNGIVSVGRGATEVLKNIEGRVNYIAACLSSLLAQSSTLRGMEVDAVVESIVSGTFSDLLLQEKEGAITLRRQLEDEDVLTGLLRKEDGEPSSNTTDLDDLVIDDVPTPPELKLVDIIVGGSESAADRLVGLHLLERVIIGMDGDASISNAADVFVNKMYTIFSSLVGDLIKGDKSFDILPSNFLVEQLGEALRYELQSAPSAPELIDTQIE